MTKRITYPFHLMLMLLIGAASLAGCAPVISKQIREQANQDITFTMILKDPQQYTGQVVILSGVILDSRATKEGTLLEVLQTPYGLRGKPKNIDESKGRFLALSTGYLDVSIAAKGREVTIAGTVQGQRTLPLGEIEYTYPLIHIKEIYLWPVERRYYAPYYYNNYWWWLSGYHW